MTNGDKHSCAMTPTLFNMMFAVMLTRAFKNCDTGFPIRYGFDDKLFNLRRMQDKSKVQTDVLDYKKPSCVFMWTGHCRVSGWNSDPEGEKAVT